MDAVKLPTEQEFWAWALQVPVTSRDTGFGPITPYGTQREAVRQIFEGLHRGVRQFLIAKAGQVGMSLIAQLLTLYWMLRYPGLQGVCAADSDDVRDYCRDNLTQMNEKALGSVATRLDNMRVVAWEHGSKLMFMTAGPRTGRRLGVGRGVAFCHGTEVPLWANPQAITYLRTRFSDVHPARLFVFEGTSRGRNFWFDIWHEAATAKDIARIFLAWWMREDYALAVDSDAYRQYWDGRLTTRERHWAGEIGRHYHKQLTPSQWAYRRWYVSEKAGGDERTADQELPTLVEDSFEATGISFLSLEAIRSARRAVKSAPVVQHWRYDFRATIEDTRLKKTIPGYSSLRVWEEPGVVDGYVVAAVPAFSATTTDPTNVAQVWRATRDTLIQVAEFASEDCGMQPFSWVCAHLVGAYSALRRAFILETIGIGQGVLQELQRLQASGWGTTRRPALADLIGGVRHYIWRRPDSLGSGAALQWRSSPEYRGWVMNRLRDQLVTERVQPRSDLLLLELERVRQTGDEFASESKDGRDHRVVAASLAVEAWAKQLRPIFERVQGYSKATNVTEKMLGEWFDRLRAKPVTAGGRR